MLPHRFVLGMVQNNPVFQKFQFATNFGICSAIQLIVLSTTCIELCISYTYINNDQQCILIYTASSIVHNVQKLASKGCADYSFHVAVTKWDSGSGDEMKAMVEEGINSFKFFMAYKNALMVSDEQMLNGFKTCKELGALAMV